MIKWKLILQGGQEQMHLRVVDMSLEKNKCSIVLPSELIFFAKKEVNPGLEDYQRNDQKTSFSWIQKTNFSPFHGYHLYQWIVDLILKKRSNIPLVLPPKLIFFPKKN